MGSAVSSLAGPGAKPQPKLNLVHFSIKIGHLVATNLIIFTQNQMTKFHIMLRHPYWGSDYWGVLENVWLNTTLWE